LERIVCQKCKWYKVSWDKNKPHQCTLFGFKSKILPSIEVQKNSGIKCNNFELKEVWKNRN